MSQTDDAREQFRKLREQADAAYDQVQNQNDPAATAIWARTYEKTRRLALIHTCSACREQPEIGRDAAEWASAFIQLRPRRMLFMARRYASESDFDAKRKRLLEVLAQWREQNGDEWMPFWRINRKLPWSARDHEEVRNTLLKQRLIDYRVMGTRGRPAACYRLALPAAPEEEGS